MPRVTLWTADDPATLLRHAAAPFIGAGRVAEPLPILAVRQGGLRDAVHTLAANGGANGWLGNPIVVFAELPELFAGAQAPLDALERAAILEAILDAQRPATIGKRAIRKSVVAALDRLFGDLVAGSIAAEELARALTRASSDEWAAARNVDVAAVYQSYVERIAALPAIAGVARTEGRDGLTRAARALIESPADVAVRIRRPLISAVPNAIHIVGLADLRRGWRALLDALKTSTVLDEVRVYATAGDEMDAGLREWLDANVDGTEHLVSPADRTVGPARCSAIAAPDVMRELESVARRVKQMLVEGDARFGSCDPADIAIVARSARPSLTRAAEVFARYGIPIHARLRHTTSEVPVVAALLRALRAAGDGWKFDGLSAVASAPYFDASLDLGLLRHIGRTMRPAGLDQWAMALEAEPENEDDPGVAQLRRESSERARRDFAEFANAARALDMPRTRAEWIVFTLDAIGGTESRGAGLLGLAANAQRPVVGSAPAVLRDAWRVDVAALRSLCAFLMNWRSALSIGTRDERTYDAGEWALELQADLAEQEFTVRAGQRGGVQLLEALAAEGRSFGHVFLLDMASDSFPAPAARDGLFTEEERQALGDVGLPIDPARVWLEREHALFESLRRSATHTLSLSYAYADASGTPRLSSPYLDAIAASAGGTEWVQRIAGSYVAPEVGMPVWSPGEALLASAYETAAAFDESRPVIAQLLHAARIERARTAARGADVPYPERAHEWNGAIDDQAALAWLGERFGDRVWSATQLESYGRCAFTFFGKYVLRARSVEDQDDDVSALDHGVVVHDALARTYERLMVAFPDEPLSVGQLDAAEGILAEEVPAAMERRGGAYRNSAGLRAAREREITTMLREYIAWEATRNSERVQRRPIHVEHAFGDGAAGGAPVAITHNGRALKLRGQIDRIDEIHIDGEPTEYRHVVDHKTGGSAFGGVTVLQQSGGVLQLALYLSVLDDILGSGKIWGGAYQLVRDQKPVAALTRCSVVKAGLKELGNATQQKHDAHIADAARIALDIVDRILAGRFAARTPDKVDCLSYCDYRDVCREERMKAWDA